MALQLLGTTVGMQLQPCCFFTLDSPPKKEKQSKLHRRAPKSKAVPKGLNPAPTIKYKIPTAPWLPRAVFLKGIDPVTCLESQGKKGAGWAAQKARPVNSHN